jgi:MOSC domain-containing protein YiiM
MAHIVSITYRPATIEQRPPDWYARVPVERTQLIPSHGIEGDTKGSAKDRQLNVMLAEAVESLREEGFKTAPGDLGEQLVIAGLASGALSPGAQVRLGASAIIEIGIPRTGCSRFAHIQGKPIKDTKGKMGFMARVIRGGEIAVGDEVRIEVGG